jgi:hypothetical protein
MNGHLSQSAINAGRHHQRELPSEVAQVDTPDARENRITQYMRRVDNGEDIFTGELLSPELRALVADMETYEDSE